MTHGSGDHWLEGPNGELVWGPYGAAGLLLFSNGHILLQHRAPWTAHGGTWGIPGGSRDDDETPAEAALREAAEETGANIADVTVLFESVMDLGWWSYTTIVATTPVQFTPKSDAESLSVEWIPVEDVEKLELHPGFAMSWPALRERLLLRVGVTLGD